MQYTDELHDAIAIATAAGSVARDYYGTSPTVHRKSDTSPVTEADYAVEQVICDRLQERYTYPVLSEETRHSGERLYSDHVWICDPIDGTRDFVEQTDDFCILLGLVAEERPVVGVMYHPVTDMLLYAVTGGGAYLQYGDAAPEPLHVSEEDTMHNMTYVVSHFIGHSRSGRMAGKALFPVFQAAEMFGFGHYIRVGSNGLRTGAIARGMADVYLYPRNNLSEWDTCAPEIIVREVGGEITDLRGNTLRYNQADVSVPYGVLASNGTRHADMLELIDQLR